MENQLKFRGKPPLTQERIMFGFLKKIFGSAHDRLLHKYSKIVTEVNKWEESYQKLSDDEVRQKTVEFKQRLDKGESVDDLLPEAYGVVKNACRRLCGTEVHVSGYDQKWDMIPYDVQILGGIAMHHGSIAEMQTGEGKTLTAVMPLYLNALTGDPVHLVTVNDYLADRDCQWVGTILRWLGMTTGSLTNEIPIHQRKSIYECDVVYGTASEFGFDYLRDNSMASSKNDQVQRGYYYAIVDEIDCILIDEARTPLIISGPVPVSRQLYDELKKGVADLVRYQRDLCNRLANEAKRALPHSATEDEEGQQSSRDTKRDKGQEEAEKEAFRKLWLVSKGMPNNRILKKVKEDPDFRSALDKWDLYYYADQNKQEKQEALSDLFIIIDEKSSEFELTDKGINAWQESTNGTGHVDDFVMMDLSHEYLQIDANRSLNEDEKSKQKLAVQEEDAKRKERAHNLRQLLRAHLLMEKDVDYIVQEEKVIIIDEHTGRPQPGRRFSDGLHQAIEAKEGLAIQKETQTYATITLQNYFRMYKKLSGMTGTATTEANEFKEIYKLDVLAIPCHRPNQRSDSNDEIYMTEREKYQAILKEMRQIHEQGRPILVGTESVEVSEKLSRILKQNQLEHTVLNAKNHAREAEIIAFAGKRSAITIATNMAGRGTDIKLEGGVAGVGGLYVMGTTRHQSRRIDRQLRGRCARQGDPGSSKFFISFEDSLLRLFASPRLTTLIQKFRPPEGEPISAGILNKSIETAQKRVEQRNYMIRKHTLEYDDVMNRQRQEIYAFRNELIHTEEILPMATQVIENVCAMAAEQYFRSRSEEGAWDPEGYRQWLINHFPVTFEEGYFDQDLLDITELEKMASTRLIEAFENKIARETKKTDMPLPPEDAPRFDSPVEYGVRHLMINRVDHLWQEHLLSMDHLRTDVNLRSVAQRDPLMEFKHEAFALFHDFSHRLQTEIARDLFRFEMIIRQPPADLDEVMSRIQLETNRSFANELEKPVQQQPQLQQQPPQQPSTNFPPMSNFEQMAIPAEELRQSSEMRLQPAVAVPQTGRNEPCPCGSGKKYKKCCGIREGE
jgi:preprotein translocase subunit SecA